MPRKVFVAGEILTAADVNTNLMDQAVMSFAGTAARGSAIPSPTEGMATYLNDQNILSLYDGSAWKNSLGVTGGILQVVQALKTDSSSTSSTSYADISGLSASITPSSSTSKILIFATVLSGGDWWETNGNLYKVIRNSTDLAISSGGTGNTSFASLGYGPAQNDTRNFIRTDSLNVLDSPATTSAVTYKLAFAIQRAGGTNYVNRNWNGSWGGSSSLTLMEVAA